LSIVLLLLLLLLLLETAAGSFGLLLLLLLLRNHIVCRQSDVAGVEVGCQDKRQAQQRQATNTNLVLPKSLGGGKFCGTYVLRSLQLGQYVSSEKRESFVSGFLNPSCR
jgi:hypothetical protein